MLTSSNFKMTFTFVIVSNIAITAVKFTNLEILKFDTSTNFSVVIAILLTMAKLNVILKSELVSIKVRLQ